MCDSGIISGFSSEGNYSGTGMSFGGASIWQRITGPTRAPAPVSSIEEIRGSRTVRVPVQRQVRTQVPVQRAVRTQVPVQRAVHGTKQVVTNVTVNRQKVETYTKVNTFLKNK